MQIHLIDCIAAFDEALFPVRIGVLDGLLGFSEMTACRRESIKSSRQPGNLLRAQDPGSPTLSEADEVVVQSASPYSHSLT